MSLCHELPGLSRRCQLIFAPTVSLAFTVFHPRSSPATFSLPFSFHFCTNFSQRPFSTMTSIPLYRGLKTALHKLLPSPLPWLERLSALYSLLCHFLLHYSCCTGFLLTTVFTVPSRSQLSPHPIAFTRKEDDLI